MARIEHVHIRASNPEKTIEFFSTFFGAKIAKQFENLGRKITLLSLEGDAGISILHQPPAVKDPKPDSAAVDHIGIVVNDIETLVPRLKQNGYKFPVDLTRSTSGAKIAFCLGPDNVQLEIIER
ncbi:MAG TPA: VOC family protein [Thermodesulfobacteriota bacterium]|nr:VOC family protein [Thermodesulfobacteriota bacterium]